MYETGEDVEEPHKDDQDDEDTSSSEDYEDLHCKPIYAAPQRGRPSPARIDDLSKPIRRRLLSLYEEYGNQLPREKLLKIKKLVEESYCLTPEQTGQYLHEIQEEADRRKKMRKQRRKEHLKHKKLKIQEKKAKVRLKVICILRDLMLKAYEQPIKILMSERLRQVSDVCLCQLCEILDREVPSRDCNEPVAKMLISFADWMAYWIETIAYDIEANKIGEPSCEKDVEYVSSRTQTDKK